MRFLLFYGLALLIAFSLTFLTLRRVRRLNPRLFKPIAFLAILGSVPWLILPFVMGSASTPFGRVLRALIAPPWFYWTVLTLLYGLLSGLLLIAWLPFMKRISLDRFASKVSAAFFFVVFVGTIVGIFQALVPLRIERVEIPVRGLPASLDGYRFGVLSDLHVGLFTRHSRLQRIVRETNALEPDAILLTGDLIDDDPYWVPKLAAGLAGLSAPHYAVLGNHEIYGHPQKVIESMRRTSIRLLVNEGTRINVGASSLWLAGLSDFAADQRGKTALSPDLDRALSGREDSDSTVLFAHQPKAFALARKASIPLTIVGHTHGGQCGFRPLGWSVAGIFLPYHMGLYQEEGSFLYVNTGTGYWVLPFRLGMTPEITLITLKRS